MVFEEVTIEQLARRPQLTAGNNTTACDDVKQEITGNQDDDNEVVKEWLNRKRDLQDEILHCKEQLKLTSQSIQYLLGALVLSGLLILLPIVLVGYFTEWKFADFFP